MRNKKENAVPVGKVYVDPYKIADFVIEEIQRRQKMLTGKGGLKLSNKGDAEFHTK